MEPKHFEELYPERTRFDEITKIIEFLKSGKSCQVVGLPGVGKSNILRLLPYNKKLRILHLGKEEEKYHFVYMDFSEVKQRNLFDIVKFILISLSYSLGERGLSEEQKTVNNFLQEGLKFQDELIFFQSLKKSIDFLANEKELHVIFLFDRFDEYTPNIDKQFFLNLKILRNRAKYNFGAVFASTRPLEDILETPIFAEFYEFLIGNIVYLPIYDKRGLEFRFSYLETISGKKSQNKIKEDLIKLTAGHGKLSRVAYEAILAQDFSEIKKLEEFLLSKGQVKASLYEIWSALVPSEKAGVRKKEKNDFLEKIGFTKEGKPAIPIFAKFLEFIPQAKAAITYDEGKNEILKGNEDLTEKLSPSEFRLLKFLLENRNRICEKNEIIENVWKDSKTREGVTDQALDQIIYRLRKKIEEDPNKPQFIQTIKGRGYKLSE